MFAAASISPAALDPNFQGFARLKTRADGFYRLLTIKPGAYPASPTWSRPPHIHLDVSGKDRRLVSQMFFPDETLNDVDEIYNSYSIRERASLTANRLDTGADGLTRLNWDIVLSEG
jgi:protocatechuate 3,4-dioxygenase beta subunit